MFLIDRQCKHTNQLLQAMLTIVPVHFQHDFGVRIGSEPYIVVFLKRLPQFLIVVYFAVKNDDVIVFSSGWLDRSERSIIASR